MKAVGSFLTHGNVLEIHAIINIWQRDTRLIGTQSACAEVVAFGVGCLVLQDVHTFKGDGMTNLIAVEDGGGFLA